jgi:hypothetical protein
MERFDDLLDLVKYVVVIETETQVVNLTAAIALYL